MSNNGAHNAQPERAAFAELESAVGTALDRLSDLTARVEAAEAKSAEMEEIVRRFTGDETEAGRLLTRLSSLQSENQDLRSRLETGREGIDRLLAKIRFLEEQR